MKNIGQRVKILSGMREFIGKKGTIVSFERHSKHNPILYRVELDEPVHIESIGVVEDDLWEAQHLRNLRKR